MDPEMEGSTIQKHHNSTVNLSICSTPETATSIIFQSEFKNHRQTLIPTIVIHTHTHAYYLKNRLIHNACTPVNRAYLCYIITLQISLRSLLRSCWSLFLFLCLSFLTREYTTMTLNSCSAQPPVVFVVDVSSLLPHFWLCIKFNRHVCVHRMCVCTVQCTVYIYFYKMYTAIWCGYVV